MKKYLIVLILVLAVVLCTGCEERKVVDISDGGKGTVETASDQTDETEEKIDKEVSEEASSEQSDEIAEESSEENSEPEEVHESFSLSYKGNTASMYVDSYYFDAEEDGNLRVVLTGTGYVFNGVIPFENNSLVVPFYTEVVVDEVTYSWISVTFGGEHLSFLFDIKKAPDQVSVFSIEDKDNKITVDGSTVPYKEPEKEEEEEEEQPDEDSSSQPVEDNTTEDLPDGWTRSVESSEEGSDVTWTETKVYDEKGRQREYSDVKQSEAYEFSVAFYTYYTYTDGSPDVEVSQEFYEFDFKTGSLYGNGSVKFTYTMQNPDNHVEIFSGWSDSDKTDGNGLIICETDSYDAKEYASDGTLVFEYSGPIAETNPQ